MSDSDCKKEGTSDHRRRQRVRDTDTAHKYVVEEDNLPMFALSNFKKSELEI